MAPVNQGVSLLAAMIACCLMVTLIVQQTSASSLETRLSRISEQEKQPEMSDEHGQSLLEKRYIWMDENANANANSNEADEEEAEEDEDEADEEMTSLRDSGGKLQPNMLLGDQAAAAPSAYAGGPARPGSASANETTKHDPKTFALDVPRILKGFGMGMGGFGLG